MAKMKQLAEEIAELKHCGEILISISESLTTLLSAADDEIPVKEDPKAEPVKVEKKTLTLEEVRAVLAIKSRDGHTDEVKALISEFGVDKLSDVDPSQYEELLKKAEVI